jgi:cyanophycinase
MSVHLVGGGWSESTYPAVYGPFLRECRSRAANRSRQLPRIAVIQLYDRTVEDGTAKFAQFADILAGLGPVSATPVLVAEGDVLPAVDLEDLDGLLVAGGPTPHYLTAVEPVAARIRQLVARGAPYLGFSAGAGIAASAAVVGGWRRGDLVIAREDCSEGLEQLTTVPGLGLVDFAVDAHAAQWGNLSRVITAVECGDVDRAVSIDEDTVCIVAGAEVRTAGAGRAWWVTRTEDGVRIRTTRDDRDEGRVKMGE